MTDRLHRIHASPASGKGGCSLDIGPFRWRGEGGARADGELKRPMAHRLALCWNLCEGWPTEVLEEGALRDVFALAGELAAVVVAHEHAQVTTEAANRARHLLALMASLEQRHDMTGGPADCDACYPPAADVAP